MLVCCAQCICCRVDPAEKVCCCRSLSTQTRYDSDLPRVVTEKQGATSFNSKWVILRVPKFSIVGQILMGSSISSRDRLSLASSL
jgi:hypothetical protein